MASIAGCGHGHRVAQAEDKRGSYRLRRRAADQDAEASNDAQA
jgi:hypothetical protein